MRNLKRYIQNFGKNVKENIKSLQLLCKKSEDSNIKRNKILLNLTFYFRIMHQKDIELEKQKKKTKLKTKRKDIEIRRIPRTLASYIEKYCDITLRRCIKSTINTLDEDEESLTFHFNKIHNFENEYDLSMGSFLEKIRPKQIKKKSRKKISKRIEKKKLKKPIRKKTFLKSNKETNERQSVGLPNIYADYEAEKFKFKIINRQKFPISYLGNQTMNGHIGTLRQIKNSTPAFIWPDGLQPLQSSDFLFSGNLPPIQDICDKTDVLPLVPKRQVLAFAHSFNSFFRNNLEPHFEVSDVFVAAHNLHSYKATGFFFILNNGNIFHACCSCSNITKADFRH